MGRNVTLTTLGLCTMNAREDRENCEVDCKGNAANEKVHTENVGHQDGGEGGGG